MPQFSADFFLYLLIAYLLGSIPTAVWVSRLFFKNDIRNFGSGNAGATNTLRVYGAKAAIPVLLIDIAKGLAAVLLAHLIISGPGQENNLLAYKLLLGLAAMAGHIFPVLAGFKGGKGVATLLGVLLGVNLLIALICIILFAIVLFLSRYVSLGSILAALAFPILLGLFYPSAKFFHYFLATLYPLIVIITHRANINRLKNGTENKFLAKK